MYINAYKCIFPLAQWCCQNELGLWPRVATVSHCTTLHCENLEVQHPRWILTLWHCRGLWDGGGEHHPRPKPAFVQATAFVTGNGWKGRLKQWFIGVMNSYDRCSTSWTTNMVGIEVGKMLLPMWPKPPARRRYGAAGEASQRQRSLRQRSYPTMRAVP